MRASFSLRDIAAVVYREEDVGRFGEVWESIAEGTWVWSLEDHEGHAWTEEHDVGRLVF